jgi:hypothetical protein
MNHAAMDFDNSTSRGPQSRVMGSDLCEHQRTKQRLISLLSFCSAVLLPFYCFLLCDQWFPSHFLFGFTPTRHAEQASSHNFHKLDL